MSAGRFIVFEGIDGCGKSTQARRCARDRDGLFTFEPGDTRLGRELRHWLLDVEEPMSAVVESLLMLADRSHHVSTVIAPTLAGGRDVIADRYWPSTLAYQGYGRGLDLDQLRAATQLAIGACRPDVIILVDVDLETAFQRGGRDQQDRFESATHDFHERVRQGYLEMARGDDQWVVIDGTSPEDVVAARVDEVVRSRW